jgi:hypothetical protein
VMRYGIWALAALVLGALGTHFLLVDRGHARPAARCRRRAA